MIVSDIERQKHITHTQHSQNTILLSIQTPDC